MILWNKSVIVVAAALTLTCGQAAPAMPILFTGTSGNLSASALFDTSGNSLVITLTNTSTEDVMEPGEILTAIFFEVSGADLILTPVSAVLGPGSQVLFGTTDPGGAVGGEWSYTRANFEPIGLVGYGISSSGLDYFGPKNLFPGSNLQGPASPDGVQYGLTSQGDNPATGNAPVTGTNALIQNQVVFTLSGLPAGFDPSTQITRVAWQYGTSFDEPFIHTPEPATCILLTLPLAAGLFRNRRRAAVPA